MKSNDPVAGPPKTLSRRLIDTKIFDDEYYAAQLGRSFETKAAAALHFKQYGMKSGLSFHPLFDLSFFPSHFRTAYRAANLGYLFEYFRSAESRTHKWSVLLDPRTLVEDESKRSLVLSRFRSDQERELPAPTNYLGEVPAWLTARAQLIEHARSVRRFRDARKPFRYRVWDENRELEWLADVQSAEGRTVRNGRGPKVSIVMPVWNRAGMIRTALESVLAQTSQSWELIVVDDGSTDETPEIISQYADADARIRLISGGHGGVCAARNTALAAATGTYVAFLDSDNTWRPDYLANMLAGMQATGCRAAYAGMRMLNDGIEFTGQPVDIDMLIQRNYVDLNVLVCEAALLREIGGFDQSLRRWVDYDLALQIIEHTSIEFFPFIGCDYVDDHNPDRITRKESENWEYKVLGRHVPGHVLGSRGKAETTGLAVVVRVQQNAALSVRNIRALLEDNDVDPRSVVVLDELEDRAQSQRLRAALLGLPELTFLKMPRTYTPAIAWNTGLGAVPAAVAVFMSSSVEFKAGAFDQLVASMEESSVGAAQPLVVDGAGVVLSAGYAEQARGPAVPLFRGLPIADATRHSGTNVDQLDQSVFALRVPDEGRAALFDTIFASDACVTDLMRRIRSSGDAEFLCIGSAVAVDHARDTWVRAPEFVPRDLSWLPPASPNGVSLQDHYSQAGFTIDALRVGQDPSTVPPEPVLRLQRAGQGLRWAIKICPDFTSGGDRWGDVPYARDLSQALEKQGHTTVIDRAGAFARPTSYLDDVVLVIRGLRPCFPQPDTLNMIWVISRPDMVTREELAGFDVVFGASRFWCDYVQREWGIEAIYLPQATNPARFCSPEGKRDEKYAATFVGGPRKPIGRKIVDDWVTEGLPLNVWGPRWEQFVPDSMVVADFVDNDQLSAVYAASKVVLNDHFEDMAQWGFANNRLYDAVASGARVISDPVDGIEEIFRGAVQTYKDASELRALFDTEASFPDDEEMEKISEMIRTEHSFDRRAEMLAGIAGRLGRRE